jgi:hypothetical protein
VGLILNLRSFRYENPSGERRLPACSSGELAEMGV